MAYGYREQKRITDPGCTGSQKSQRLHYLVFKSQNSTSVFDAIDKSSNSDHDSMYWLLRSVLSRAKL